MRSQGCWDAVCDTKLRERAKKLMLHQGMRFKVGGTCVEGTVYKEGVIKIQAMGNKIIDGRSRDDAKRIQKIKRIKKTKKE